MLHLALMVPLLAAPPTLVERLQLGVASEVVQARPDLGGAHPGEVLAGTGGMLLGHLGVIALGGLTAGPSIAATVTSARAHPPPTT